MLELRGITKDFPGVRALDGVDLSLGRGEVLGLLGENGAGKSTLIKILGGIHPAGSFGGTLRVAGSEKRFGSVMDARRAGVVVVNQELSLIPAMTVAENLVLGAEPTRAGLLDHEATIRQARALLAPLVEASGGSTNIDLEAPAERLGVGTQQIVEIARALGASARIVVLDEPTAALTAGETAQLFEIVRACRARGTSFVYISHRLEEIFEICDRVLVLRDGRRVGGAPVTDIDTDGIVALMTGSERAALERGARGPESSPVGEVVLQVEHLSMAHPTRPHRRVLDDVSLQVRAGEIVALAGAMGAGRTALLSALFGIGRGPLSGRVLVDGRPALARSPREAIARGLALVPEDRKEHGLVPGMTVAENLLLADGATHGPRLLDPARSLRRARDQAGRLALRGAGVSVAVDTLSGGNQQKIVLGKWMALRPRVLLLDEPTRGVDVGARGEIYRLLRALCGEGHAVLMASSDLAEVELLADRVVVLREGRVAGILAGPEIEQRAIMDRAVGVACAA